MVRKNPGPEVTIYIFVGYHNRIVQKGPPLALLHPKKFEICDTKLFFCKNDLSTI